MMVETNINAYRQELPVAESELSRAQARYDELKAHVDAYDKAAAKETKQEPAETETSDDELVKPISKQNRAELNATAEKQGVENPEQYETKQEVIDAIEETYSESEN